MILKLGSKPEAPIITVSSGGFVLAAPPNAKSETQVTTHTLSSDDDADFVAENIKSGVTVFGLKGTYGGTVTLTVTNNSASAIYVTHADIETGAVTTTTCASNTTEKIVVLKNSIIALEVKAGNGSSSGVTKVPLQDGYSYYDQDAGLFISLYVATGTAKITWS